MSLIVAETLGECSSQQRKLISKLGGVGADTVIMGFWGGSSRWEAAEKCVRLQLCILVSTLGFHVFG